MEKEQKEQIKRKDIKTSEKEKGSWIKELTKINLKK